MSQYKRVTQFSAESWSVVKRAEDTQGTAELSCDRMILEYTHKTNTAIYTEILTSLSRSTLSIRKWSLMIVASSRYEKKGNTKGN